MRDCRWGPQEEDTQKYKRKQKLYLSDRVSSFLSHQSARNVAHARMAFFVFELLLMVDFQDAHLQFGVLHILPQHLCFVVTFCGCILRRRMGLS